MHPSFLDCSGFCRHCGTTHSLPATPALSAAKDLMAQLLAHGNIGLGLAHNPRLDLAYLFGSARGQMFGVLVYQDATGNVGALKAFSGQYNGLWHVPGWVGPILDEHAFAQTIAHDEPRIKDLTYRLTHLGPDDPLRAKLLSQRKTLSQNLMARIFDLYELTNFYGQTRCLADVFIGQAMPTGTAECCAPKLLHHAARQGLTPLGLAEFYLGRSNPSATRVSGRFYPPCAHKCAPILGFLLCGLETTRH